MRHLSISVCLVAVMGTFVCAWSAAAQTRRLPPEPEEQTAEQPTFTLAPAISLTELGVDTNILAVSQNPQRDTTGHFGMKAEPVSYLGRVSMRGRATVGWAYFRQYTQLRSVDTDDMGRIDVRLNRVTLFGAGTILRTGDVFGPEIDVRTMRTQHSIEAGGEVRLSKRTRVTVDGRHMRVKFDDTEVLFDSALRNALDRGTDTMEVQFRNNVTPLTALAVLTDVQRDQFDYAPLRNTGSFRVMAGVETTPSALIDGQAYVGYRAFRPDDPTVPDVGTLAASVDVGYTLAEVTRFGLHVVRDLGNSYSLTERYYVYTDVMGRVTHRLTPSWDITGMVGRQFLTYPDAWMLGGPVGADVSDRYLRLGLGVTTRIGRTSSISVNGESYHRESKLTGNTYDRLRLISSIEVHF